MNRLIIGIWVHMLMAGRRVVDWGRRLLADPPELHRRLMPFIIPFAVLLSQAIVVVVVESLAVIVRSMQGEDIPSLVRALPVLMRAWAIPMGLAGTLMPLIFRGIRGVAAENGGFGFHTPHARAVAADTVLGVVAGALLWLSSAALSAGLQAAGAPIPSRSSSTADAGLGMFPILVAVLAAPIAEELVFRGLVSRPLMHSGLLARPDGTRGIPVFGVVQTMLADRRGLLCPMICHVAYNLAVILSTTLV